MSNLSQINIKNEKENKKEKTKEKNIYIKSFHKINVYM